MGNKPPVSRYQVSPREYPEKLEPIEYGPGDIVLPVKTKGVGYIYFEKRRFRIGGAFIGYDVALRPTLKDGVFDVYFCAQKITQIDLGSMGRE